MGVADLLQVKQGITPIVGGGGKTTLMYRMAEELHKRGSVIICTSTKIMVPEHLPVLTYAGEDAVKEALAEHGMICVGEVAGERKLRCPARLSFQRLADLADYVLVEADGAKCLPLKAHEPFEPVIPEGSGKTVYVIGIDGIGKPLNMVCHRPERYSALCGVSLDEPVTPAMAAKVICAEKYGDIFFINKTEWPSRFIYAVELAGLLPGPVVCGSLRKGEFQCLY